MACRLEILAQYTLSRCRRRGASICGEGFRQRNDLHRTSKLIDCRSGAAGFNDRDFDAERSDLFGQRLRETLNPELRGRVGCAPCGSEASCDRRYLDDVSCPERSRRDPYTSDTPGEVPRHSPRERSWIGGARGGLVCVERTLLSAAFDSGPEKRERSRSNRTGQQPDARTREFIPPFGDATPPKSPALCFAIGRAIHSQPYINYRRMSS